MICRRCGMDSSTTDVCEWCKKPMLPEGGSISNKAKEEIVKQRAQGEAATGAASPQGTQETELEASVRRPESAPPPPPSEVHVSGLRTLDASLSTQEEHAPPPSFATAEQTVNAELLRPLGAVPLGGRQQEEGSSTTLYVGNDEDVLRPVERPGSTDGGKYTIDATGRKKRVIDNTPEIPDRVRMARGMVQGAIIAFLVVMVQFFMKHEVPSMFVMLPIGDGKTLGGALFYGACSAFLMGPMFAAAMVQFKLGPAVGFLIGGLGLGVFAMLNAPNWPWSAIAGALCGIFVGRASVKGLKRVVNV
jgi:hypothetical protein